MKTRVSVLLALILSACATTISPTRLQPVTGLSAVGLRESLHWEEVVGLFDDGNRYSLAPGLYVPIKQDAQGVYYQGPAYCLMGSHWSRGGKPLSEDSISEGVSHCGIYIPHDAAQSAKVYVVMHSGRQTKVPKNLPNRDQVPTIDPSELQHWQAKTPIVEGAMPVVDLPTRLQLTETVRMSSPALTNAPLASAVGTEVGILLVEALIHMERGNYIFLPSGPRNFRAALVR